MTPLIEDLIAFIAIGLGLLVWLAVTLAG